MKKTLPLIMAVLAAFALPCAKGVSAIADQNAADPAVNADTPAQPGWVKEFEQLDEAVRQQYIEQFMQAEALMQQKRIIECLRMTEELEKIFAGNPGLYNLRGACYMEIRDVDSALANFTKAQQMDPGNSSFEFNIAETLFVMHDYAKAAEKFKGLLDGLPDGTTPFLKSLLTFKLYICNLKLGKDDEAAKLESAFGLLDDVPFYYCVMAVKAYHQGDKAEGQQAYLSAIRIYHSSGMMQPFMDAMQESGFVFSPAGQTVVEDAAN